MELVRDQLTASAKILRDFGISCYPMSELLQPQPLSVPVNKLNLLSLGPTENV